MLTSSFVQAIAGSPSTKTAYHREHGLEVNEVMGNPYYPKIYFLIFVLSCRLFSIEAEAQSISPITMSLQECIEYALEHNADIRNAQLNVALKKREAQEALSIGLPQVSGKATTSYNFERPISFLPAEFVGGTKGTFVPVAFSPNYSGRMTINFEQMIFSASYFVGLEASKAYVDYSRKEREKMKIDLMSRVSKAYYLILVKYAYGEFIDEDYDRVDSLLRNTETQYKNGFVEQIDVDRVRIQYNNAATEKKNFKHELATSYILLKFEIGMDINAPLVLKDRLQDITVDTTSIMNKQNFNYQDRIEYDITESNINLLKLDIKNSKAKHAPELHVYGSYGGNSGTNDFSKLFQFDSNWRPFGNVGLRINVPIFDGLLRVRTTQKKQIEKAKAENQLIRLKENIDLEITKAKMIWLQSIQKMNTQKENMRLAEKIYTTTKIKYENGVGSNTDVIDANIYLKTAQNNYYEALYNALITTVDLDKAYGRLEEKLLK